MKKGILIYILVVLGASGTFLFSEANANSDKSVDAVLIKKLESVYQKLPQNNPSRAKVALRMADLLSDQAQKIETEEAAKGCDPCTNGESQRHRALELYREALDRMANKESKIRVLEQMAYLNNRLLNYSEAQSLLEKAETIDSRKGSVLFALGEIHYKRRKYSEAVTYFKRASLDSAFNEKRQSEYKTAWSLYYLGQVAEALTNFKSLLVKLKADPQEDEGFFIQASKDYITILAQSNRVAKATIDEAVELSPISQRSENLFFIAKEMKRLGRKSLAEYAWAKISEVTQSPKERLEAQVTLAELNYERQNFSGVETHFLGAVRTLNQDICQSDACADIERRLRNLLVSWTKSNRKDPLLLSLYEGFTQNVSDYDLSLISVDIASKLGDFLKAHRIATQMLVKYPKMTGNQLERVLLNRIELAQQAKDQSLEIAAQEDYVNKSVIKSQIYEIQFNLAKFRYDNKNYEVAAAEFTRLAESDDAETELRIKAADMALDTLVLLERHSDIERLSLKFKGLFPSRSNQFAEINRKSILTQTANLTADTSASGKGALAQAWSVLERYDSSTAARTDKVKFLKNKIILSKKLEKWSDMELALLDLKKEVQGNEDREFVFKNLAWVSELRLNFSGAIDALGELNKLSSRADNYLQMARFADLLGKKSKDEYANFVAKAKSEDDILPACIRIFEQSSNFFQIPKKCQAKISSNQELFSDVLMARYSEGNKKQIEALVAKYKLGGTAYGALIHRESKIDSVAGRLDRLKAHTIETATLGKDLPQRVQLITQAEKAGAQIFKDGDPVLTFLYISPLKSEYERFVNEVTTLPPPAELTSEELIEYEALLTEQIAPYESKAKQLEQKIGEFWESGIVSDLLNAQSQNHTTAREIVARHLRFIEEFAPGDWQTKISAVTSSSNESGTTISKLPTFAEVKATKDALAKDPYNKKILTQLIALEERRGKSAMVEYLKARLNAGPEEVNDAI